MITPVNKILLGNRLKSLLWRLGSVIATVLVDFGATNLELFDLPLWSVAIISLILGEVTKMLNSK